MNMRELENIYPSILKTIRSDKKDLTERQKGVLLTVYLMEDLQTVKSLSKHLGVSKAAISRAIDTLESYGFIRRLPDKRDKRSIIVNKTVQGKVYIDNWNESLVNPTNN
ncbi:MAG: hypothetical protein CFH01_00618 [Alphaproteobacteria bacterium MarineAlpha2_Bin1]|nr:MAG: hypothetical protein CFH01_00618 [Alphaproteobacteria bacterium MarineAlpha2_Bin1]|tara:strand:+ start:1450 stop:1776 length:327 start_codon:yes stop_codon:yes gene_type:complete